MFSKKIKLAEKLIVQKKTAQGITLLLQLIVDLNSIEDYPLKKREKALAGKLLANIFLIKNYRKILFQLTKGIASSGIIFLIQEVVQYGQLEGAMH